MGTFERAREWGARIGQREGNRVGNEIRIARMAAGLSQRELGRRCGMSHAAIGRLERLGVRRVTIDRLAMIAAILGLGLGR